LIDKQKTTRAGLEEVDFQLWVVFSLPLIRNLNPEIIRRRCLSPGALRLLEDGEREKCGRSILRIGCGMIIFRVE
jgi:hypothetical protein